MDEGQRDPTTTAEHLDGPEGQVDVDQGQGQLPVTQIQNLIKQSPSILSTTEDDCSPFMWASPLAGKSIKWSPQLSQCSSLQVNQDQSSPIDTGKHFSRDIFLQTGRFDRDIDMLLQEAELTSSQSPGEVVQEEEESLVDEDEEALRRQLIRQLPEGNSSLLEQNQNLDNFSVDQSNFTFGELSLSADSYIIAESINQTQLSNSASMDQSIRSALADFNAQPSDFVNPNGKLRHPSLLLNNKEVPFEEVIQKLDENRMRNGSVHNLNDSFSSEVTEPEELMQSEPPIALLMYSQPKVWTDDAGEPTKLIEDSHDQDEDVIEDAQEKALDNVEQSASTAGLWMQEDMLQTIVPFRPIPSNTNSSSHVTNNRSVIEVVTSTSPVQVQSDATIPSEDTVANLSTSSRTSAHSASSSASQNKKSSSSKTFAQAPVSSSEKRKKQKKVASQASLTGSTTVQQEPDRRGSPSKIPQATKSIQHRKSTALQNTSRESLKSSLNESNSSSGSKTGISKLNNIKPQQQAKVKTSMISVSETHSTGSIMQQTSTTRIASRSEPSTHDQSNSPLTHTAMMTKSKQSLGDEVASAVPMSSQLSPQELMLQELHQSRIALQGQGQLYLGQQTNSVPIYDSQHNQNRHGNHQDQIYSKILHNQDPGLINDQHRFHSHGQQPPGYQVKFSQTQQSQGHHVKGQQHQRPQNYIVQQHQSQMDQDQSQLDQHGHDHPTQDGHGQHTQGYLGQSLQYQGHLDQQLHIQPSQHENGQQSHGYLPQQEQPSHSQLDLGQQRQSQQQQAQHKQGHLDQVEQSQSNLGQKGQVHRPITHRGHSQQSQSQNYHNQLPMVHPVHDHPSQGHSVQHNQDHMGMNFYKPRKIISDHSGKIKPSAQSVDELLADVGTDVLSMEQVRGHLHKMLKQPANTLPEKSYDSAQMQSLLLGEDQAEESLLSNSTFPTAVSKSLADLTAQMESLTRGSAVSSLDAGSVALARGEATLVMENQLVRETLEKEMFRRKHCEKQIHLLQSKLLEIQQQLAVAVNTDRKKDTMIEQLDKTLAKVVDGWRKREAEKVDVIQRLKLENQQLTTRMDAQAELLHKFEAETAVVVNQLTAAQQSVEMAQRDRDHKVALADCERMELLETLQEEQEHLRNMTSKRDHFCTQTDKLSVQLRDIQGTLEADRNTWEEKEQEYLQKIDEITNNHLMVVEQEKNKSDKQGQVLCDTQEVLAATQSEVHELRMSLDGTTREKESLHVQLGILEAKMETALRKQEADLRSEAERELSSKLSESHRRQRIAEEERSERHRHQVSDLTQHHTAELKELHHQHQDALRRKDEAFTKAALEFEERLGEGQLEIESLQNSVQKLEGQRMEVTNKLQTMMQAHCNEAIRILMNGGTPTTTAITSAVNKHLDMGMYTMGLMDSEPDTTQEFQLQEYGLDQTPSR